MSTSISAKKMEVAILGKDWFWNVTLRFASLRFKSLQVESRIISELRAVNLAIFEFWAATRPVFELRTVRQWVGGHVSLHIPSRYLPAQS